MFFCASILDQPPRKWNQRNSDSKTFIDLIDMDQSDDTEEYHNSFEPVVIIEDDDSHPKFYNECSEPEQDPLSFEDPLPEYVRRISSEISITPVWNIKPKESSFHKEYSPSKDDHTVKIYSTNTLPRRSREQVRRISRDEALNAEDTYTRRKTSPLEKCPVCKKFFRRLKTHMLKHESFFDECSSKSERLFCSLCQKVFNTPSNLSIHMRSHFGDRQYVCDICNKSFSQSCNLINHRRVHTGERPYKCPHCDKAFTQSGNLNNHIRLHTDEKPFKCHFCDRAFAQSGNLGSHIRNNHKFDHGFAMFALGSSI